MSLARAMHAACSCFLRLLALAAFFALIWWCPAVVPAGIACLMLVRILKP